MNAFQSPILKETSKKGSLPCLANSYRLQILVYFVGLFLGCGIGNECIVTHAHKIYVWGAPMLPKKAHVLIEERYHSCIPYKEEIKSFILNLVSVREPEMSWILFQTNTLYSGFKFISQFPCLLLLFTINNNCLL